MNGCQVDFCHLEIEVIVGHYEKMPSFPVFNIPFLAEDAVK